MVDNPIEKEKDCAWCGGEYGIDAKHSYPNRNGEVFCSPYHRRVSNQALITLLSRNEDEE